MGYEGYYMYYVKSIGIHEYYAKSTSENMNSQHALCLEYSQAISTMLKVLTRNMKNLQALY